MRSRALTLTWAGLGFFFVAAAVAVPIFLGAGNNLVIALTSFIFGIQAGQSAAVQTDYRARHAFLDKSWLLFALTLVLSISVALISTPVAIVAAATAAGALIGVRLGRVAAEVLAQSGGQRFQRFIAERSCWLLLASGISSLCVPLVGSFAFVVFAVISGLLLWQSVPSLQPDEVRPKPSLGANLTMVLGVCGSLYYRNDVNWLRSSVSANADFFLWHLSLIAYAAIQGAVGFLAVQIFFARRNHWKPKIEVYLRRHGTIALAAWIGIVVAMLWLAPQLPVLLAVALIAFVAVFVGVFSSFAHVCGVSWFAYVAGILGTSVLLLLLALSVDPRMTLASGAAVSGSIMLVALVLRSRRTP
jgi:hypothetical protein